MDWTLLDWAAVAALGGRLDFDARVGEPLAHGVPHVAARQHQLEQLPPYLAYVLFDPPSDPRRRLDRIDPVILQIPADIFRVLCSEREGERPLLYQARTIAL